MHISTALDEFFFSKDFTPSAHRWYRQKLTTFRRWCLEHDCTTTDVLSAPTIRQFIHHLRSTPSARTGQPLTGNTLHGFMRCIKAFINWGIREGLVDERIPRRLEMPKKEVKVIEVFTPQQIEQLLTECEREELPWLVERDKAILAVLFDTGLRAKELCDLTLDRARMTIDDSYLVVNGKGRKQREVGLGR